ncbi:MAG: hypothetical protein JWP97_5050, partial [Labilithrix sp.]|nr:hypothetical protein [Labilithrix sp.]
MRFVSSLALALGLALTHVACGPTDGRPPGAPVDARTGSGGADRAA